IEEFASDDATVVVGTVIDPSLKDEMRVTVVATGLGDLHARPTKVVDNTDREITTDYRQLDRPAVMRNRQGSGRAAAAVVGSDTDMDYLDIPAFLRKQAD
ncbi:cell division protein FtsZ, partial [Gammaproteobacteria bacterium]|nr:cell division protein FtsZ [Gammaproteobacteria bacterium]